MNAVRLPARRALEFGIYRDGDNNLDSSQEAAVRQAVSVSAANAAIQFTVEDTREGFGSAATFRSTIQDGNETAGSVDGVDDMALPQNLARFVARTLDNAQKSGAKQTWIELVDHGAGDGGGLEADSFKQLMPMPQIAGAIAAGVAMHARAHPEDAGRTVDGVVANQCLMASLGFADALSHAGVKWLAASPETRGYSLHNPAPRTEKAGIAGARSALHGGTRFHQPIPPYKESTAPNLLQEYVSPLAARGP